VEQNSPQKSGTKEVWKRTQFASLVCHKQFDFYRGRHYAYLCKTKTKGHKMITKVNEMMMTQTEKLTAGKISTAWFIITYTALFVAGLTLTLIKR